MGKRQNDSSGLPRRSHYVNENVMSFAALVWRPPLLGMPDMCLAGSNVRLARDPAIATRLAFTSRLSVANILGQFPTLFAAILEGRTLNAP